VKIKDVFLGVLIVALLVSEVFMFMAKQRERDARGQLSQAQHDIQQAKADLDQLRANDDAAQQAMRTENQNLSQRNTRLTTENNQLRSENLKLNQQLNSAAAQIQQQRVQQTQTEPAPQPTVEQNPADADRDVCLANLHSIQVAKAQWALENGKTAADMPTEQDLLIFLPNNLFPVCPSGGTYTIGTIGVTPTCTIAGHVLPQ